MGFWAYQYPDSVAFWVGTTSAVWVCHTAPHVPMEVPGAPWSWVGGMTLHLLYTTFWWPPGFRHCISVSCVQALISFEARNLCRDCVSQQCLVWCWSFKCHLNACWMKAGLYYEGKVISWAGFGTCWLMMLNQCRQVQAFSIIVFYLSSFDCKPQEPTLNNLRKEYIGRLLW